MKMKVFFIILLVIFAGLFSGIGIASFGNAPPASSGTLVLLGLGLVGLVLWGRRKINR